MLFSFEQVELMKLMQEEIARKQRHAWGYYVDKKEKKNESRNLRMKRYNG